VFAVIAIPLSPSTSLICFSILGTCPTLVNSSSAGSVVSWNVVVTKDLIDYENVIWPIYREIEFIKANARICNITNAIEHYTIVKKMIEHLNCKC